MIKKISKLGPGLLFAAAAIGVSHLVQSTRAGADFGWGLIWALILVNIFKYPFWILYRVWFYVLVIIPILVLLPLLLVSITKEKWYPLFFRLARIWSKTILIGMGFNWKIDRFESLEEHKSYMFITNHTSMIDIMLMLVTIKNHPFVFVGKKELAKIPLFGYFYRKIISF